MWSRKRQICSISLWMNLWPCSMKILKKMREKCWSVCFLSKTIRFFTNTRDCLEKYCRKFQRTKSLSRKIRLKSYIPRSAKFLIPNFWVPAKRWKKGSISLWRGTLPRKTTCLPALWPNSKAISILYLKWRDTWPCIRKRWWSWEIRWVLQKLKKITWAICWRRKLVLHPFKWIMIK